MLLYQTLAFTMHEKILKNHTKIINLEYGMKLQHGMKNLNYLIGHIMYQILKIVLNIS